MIKGKNINLRTVREDDLDEMFILTSDLSQRGQYLNLNLSSEAMYKKRYHDTGLWNDDFGIMAITDKNDRLIGEIVYFKGVWYLPGYEIGYRIYKDEDKGRGYITEALRIFTAYMFELKPINRLEIQVLKGNIASCKVAEKCGYKYEGLKRQAAFSQGRYHDMELFAILREESESLQQALKQ